MNSHVFTSNKPGWVVVSHEWWHMFGYRVGDGISGNKNSVKCVAM